MTASASTWAVLPVKPFDDAKSRLQPVIDAAQRRSLARALLLHSLAALRECSGIDRVLVVSADGEALALAAEHGAEALRESAPGLNPALEEARRNAVERGAEALLVLASDLPLLVAEDIGALLAADAGAAIAPDRRRLGTNALLLRPPGAIEFSFGESSYERHRELALAAGLTLSEVFRTGLAFDIDLPRDWHDLMSSGWEGLPELPMIWSRA